MTIDLDECRACSDRYVHTWQGWTTRVVLGVPRDRTYKAVSYVWGDTQPIQLRCRRCDHVTVVPMASEAKFRRLMQLTDRPDQALWLDALSIDQRNPADVAASIARMGEIYRNASAVAVLLPTADREAFEILARVYDLAGLIHTMRVVFAGNNDGPEAIELGRACTAFVALLEDFYSKVDRWTYWRRAWTLQEWALATEISLSFEAGPAVNIPNLKCPILAAATTIAIYKLQCSYYALVEVGKTRGAIPPFFDKVKQIFPDENAFLPPGAVSAGAAFGVLPGREFGNMLGLRRAFDKADAECYNAFSLDAPLPSAPKERLFQRLSMVLYARSVSKREARFEADIVASWASMCNLRYDYHQDDSYAIALQKVLKSLREQAGIQVYNFQANTHGASGEVDLAFDNYATLAVQGLSIFNGQTTVRTHLTGAMTTLLPQKPSLQGSGVLLLKVRHASFERTMLLSDCEAATEAIFSTAESLDNPYFSNDDKKQTKEFLESISSEANRITLVLVHVRTEDEKRKTPLRCWSVCPASLDLKKCFVAREGLNGTLVLVSPTEKACEIVAYFVMTDQISVTSLVMIDESGAIDLPLSAPMQKFRHKGVSRRTKLEKGSIMAF